MLLDLGRAVDAMDDMIEVLIPGELLFGSFMTYGWRLSGSDMLNVSLKSGPKAYC